MELSAWLLRIIYDTILQVNLKSQKNQRREKRISNQKVRPAQKLAGQLHARCGFLQRHQINNCSTKGEHYRILGTVYVIDKQLASAILLAKTRSETKNKIVLYTVPVILVIPVIQLLPDSVSSVLRIMQQSTCPPVSLCLTEAIDSLLCPFGITKDRSSYPNEICFPVS